MRAEHGIWVLVEVEDLWLALFAVHVEAGLHFLLAGDLRRIVGDFLRVGRRGVLAAEVVVGLALGDEGLLERTLLARLLLLLDEHGHVVTLLLCLLGKLVGGVNILLADLGLSAELVDLFRRRLFYFEDVVVSDVADVVVDVVVDDGDVKAVALDLLFFGLCLPLAVDVRDVQVGGFVAFPHRLGSRLGGVEVV